MIFKNFTIFKTVILSIIVVIAMFLRFYMLGSVPPSPDWDEAALGYNAYSILTTGKDEHGNFLPVLLKSFGDYKPALYAYLAIPFIKIFGLTTFAVRLPGAIAGVIGVVFTYLLVIELFGIRRHKFPYTLQIPTRVEVLALLSALLFAISPWDIQFSRVAFEAQVGMILNMGAILFFLKGLRKGSLLTVSAVLAAASIYMYQSEKVYLPILFIVLAVIYWKELLMVSKKYLALAVFLGLLLCLPMAASIVSDDSALSRAKGVSIFSQSSEEKKLAAEKLADDLARGDVLGLVLDNRRIEFAKLAVSGYISHFSPNWLFITGDIPRHHAPGMGLLYLVELPFLLVGMYILLFGSFSKKTKLTILAIFLVVPIPASVTSDVPHAVRTINFLPTFQILTALGVIGAWMFISNIKREIKYTVYAIVSLLFAFNFLYYLNQYFVQQKFYTASDWQYGYQQAVEYLRTRDHQYKKVIVSDVRPLDQSYIFFLYYLQYSPDQYQKDGSSKAFGKYIFKSIDPKDLDEKGVAIVTGPVGIDSIKPSRIIYNPDGTEAIKIMEN